MNRKTEKSGNGTLKLFSSPSSTNSSIRSSILSTFSNGSSFSSSSSTGKSITVGGEKVLVPSFHNAKMGNENSYGTNEIKKLGTTDTISKGSILSYFKPVGPAVTSSFKPINYTSAQTIECRNKLRLAAEKNKKKRRYFNYYNSRKREKMRAANL